MTLDELTDPQRAALAVLVDTRTSWGEPRPVRASNRTTRDMRGREMLTVHRAVAFQLVDAGVVQVTNAYLETLELTDAGRALAREAGL